MEVTVKRADDNSLTLQFKIPWSTVEKTRTQITDDLIKGVEVAGFRKGKAPRELAEKKLSKEQVQEEVLRKVVTDSYNDAIKKENLTPIITPRIHVEQFDEGTDVTFTAETCELPKVNLKNYKDDVKKITAKSKILVPGKEETGAVKTDDIINAALKTIEVTIPKVLVEQESNRLLSNMLDELKTLGMTLDQYLTSRNKTSDDLRVEYEQKAEQDLKIEFMLRAIADEEKIAVEEKDITDVLNSLQDAQQKADIAKNPYLLAALIRQQKTLDFLTKM